MIPRLQVVAVAQADSTQLVVTHMATTHWSHTIGALVLF